MEDLTGVPNSREHGHVSLEAVEVAFGRGVSTTLAIGPISLELEPGSFTALVGPTGCGKSTALNVIAGFVQATRGRVSVDGEVVTGPNPDIGVVFQQYALFPWLTARGNVEFALKRFDLPRNERRERAMSALNEVGLAERSGHYPAELSGGMQQRVALARTFVGEPKVFLMDEPFGALDAQTRLAMQVLLMDVWQRRRTTVLFVTHDVDEAITLADRVQVMSAGPGRLIDSFGIEDPRPRSVERPTERALEVRPRILHLLRQEGGMKLSQQEDS